MLNKSFKNIKNFVRLGQLIKKTKLKTLEKKQKLLVLSVLGFAMVVMKF